LYNLRTFLVYTTVNEWIVGRREWTSDKLNSVDAASVRRACGECSKRKYLGGQGLTFALVAVFSVSNVAPTTRGKIRASKHKSLLVFFPKLTSKNTPLQIGENVKFTDGDSFFPKLTSKYSIALCFVVMHVNLKLAARAIYGVKP
jgi:hypothetical protein